MQPPTLAEELTALYSVYEWTRLLFGYGTKMGHFPLLLKTPHHGMWCNEGPAKGCLGWKKELEREHQ